MGLEQHLLLSQILQQIAPLLIQLVKRRERLICMNQLPQHLVVALLLAALKQRLSSGEQTRALCPRRREVDGVVRGAELRWSQQQMYMRSIL